MDEPAIGSTGAFGDTPAESLLGAGKNLTDAAAVQEADFVGMDMVTEATGLDDGDETPANLGFLLLGELDRDDTGREGTVEQRPETFADAGGVDDDVLGVPGFGQTLELAEDGQVVFAKPTMAGDDMVGGMAEVGEGGEVDADNGEGGGIAAGVGALPTLPSAEAALEREDENSSMPATSRRKATSPPAPLQMEEPFGEGGKTERGEEGI